MDVQTFFLSSERAAIARWAKKHDLIYENLIIPLALGIPSDFGFWGWGFFCFESFLNVPKIGAVVSPCLKKGTSPLLSVQSNCL